MSDEPKAIKVVPITPSLIHLVEGPFRWQVCFHHRPRLATKSKLIASEVHDWLFYNTRDEVKVLDEAVWFENEEEALLCLMRFGGGQ